MIYTIKNDTQWLDPREKYLNKNKPKNYRLSCDSYADVPQLVQNGMAHMKQKGDFKPLVIEFPHKEISFCRATDLSLFLSLLYAEMNSEYERRRIFLSQFGLDSIDRLFNK